MGYYFDSRVRFSESGTDGHLTLPGILDYYQDCCTFQADSIDQGHKELVKRNRVWVLNSWNILVYRYPKTGEYIRTTTMPYKLAMCFGHRNFKMETSDGEVLSEANTLWTYLNIKTGRPERLREEDLAGYVLDEPLKMPERGRKIQIPQEIRKEEPFIIRKQNLDANQHVNNVQYVRMALDYVPDACHVREMRAEYHLQAFLEDVFYPEISVSGNCTVVVFRNSEGAVYGVVEFITKE